MESKDIQVGKVFLTSKPIEGGFEPVHAKCIKKFANTSLMQHVDGPMKGRIFTVPDGQVLNLAAAEMQPVTVETAAQIKKNIADLGKDEVAGTMVKGEAKVDPPVVLPESVGETVYTGAKEGPTLSKETIAEAVKHADSAAEVEKVYELEEAPEPPAPTLAEKASSTLNELDKMTVDAAKVLTQNLPPKDNLKKKIIELLKAGHKSPDIAKSLDVKVAYVGQIKIDYLGEGPKEGTKKFEVLQKHKAGMEPAAIAQELGTSVGFVTQQIRLEKKRVEAQA